MPNLRVLYENVASAAALVASSTAGSLAAANMLTDTKAEVHRSVGKEVTYTLTWATEQRVGAVTLPATNLSASAQMRVQIFSDAAGLGVLFDSGEVAACPSPHLGLHGWPSINANAFAFGGASKAAVWLPVQPENVKRCVITIKDPDNAAGYIDCARLVVGPYWEADKNPNYGATAGSHDLTKTMRSESGDAFVSRGASYQTMSLQLADMTDKSRATLAKIVRSAGTYRNMFFSLLPDNPSGAAEQDHMIYGKRANAPFSFDYFDGFSTRIEIEGW